MADYPVLDALQYGGKAYPIGARVSVADDADDIDVELLQSLGVLGASQTAEPKADAEAAAAEAQAKADAEAAAAEAQAKADAEAAAAEAQAKSEPAAAARTTKAKAG